MTHFNENDLSQMSIDDILTADSNTLMPNTWDAENPPIWVHVSEVLYQPIVVTRANVTTVNDKIRGEVERAFINFYYRDDEDKIAYVFATGWNSLKNQVVHLARLRAFPLECGIVEMLDKKPFYDNGNAYYPLRFAKSEALKGLELDAIAAHNGGAPAATDVETVDNSVSTSLAAQAGPNDAATTERKGVDFKNLPKKKPPFGTRGN